MRGRISQKWRGFMTRDQGIDCYGYWLVIENVYCCDWDSWLVIENVNYYNGQGYQLLIENNGCYGPKKWLNVKTDDCCCRKKIGVWKLSSRNDPECLPLGLRTRRSDNKLGIVQYFDMRRSKAKKPSSKKVMSNCHQQVNKVVVNISRGL